MFLYQVTCLQCLACITNETLKKKLSSVPLTLHSACEDGSTPAAVAESAAKVLNTCLAAMPAGRLSHSLFLQALQN